VSAHKNAPSKRRKKSTTNTSKQVDPEIWVETYADSLYRYAYFKVNDTSLAEEFVQDTFVAALGARKNFLGNASEKTWLFSILKNKIIDHLRRKYRDKVQSLETVSEKGFNEYFDERGAWLNKPGKWKVNPQERFEQSEFMSVLRDCLTLLPIRQGDAFQLREIRDFDSEEICKILGISSTNYWVILHRARLAIRACLEKNWF
jgi:RNA polymerase sigma-70 factor (TIGR02943 family)